MAENAKSQPQKKVMPEYSREQAMKEAARRHRQTKGHPAPDYKPAE